MWNNNNMLFYKLRATVGNSRYTYIRNFIEIYAVNEFSE